MALRRTFRLLRTSPALVVAGSCTLALAIGASTAVFTVVDKVLVRPLPIDAPDRAVVIGLAAAVASGRALSALLYEVTSVDPPTMAAVAGLVALIGAAATFLPARRATRVDAVEALRQ